MTLSIILSVLILITLIPTLLLLFNVQKRLRQVEKTKTELGALQEKITQSETEIKNEIKSNQTTISNTLTQQIESTTTTLVNILETLGNNQTQALENVTKSTQNLTQSNETRMDSVQKALNERFTTLQTSNEEQKR